MRRAVQALQRRAPDFEQAYPAVAVWAFRLAIGIDVLIADSQVAALPA
jgi:hypothetical protein